MIRILTFTASWCTACKVQKTLFSGLKNLTIVNLDDNEEMGQTYDIKGLPTTLIFKDSELIYRTSQLCTRIEIEDIIKHI
jgi:thioredoxin 1